MFNSSKLRQRRLDMGMTLEEVGDIVGIGRSAVQKYEKNVIKNVYTSTVELFAKALRCSPAYLLDWTDDPREGIVGPKSVILTTDENRIIEMYKNLNEEGKEKVQQYIGDITASGNYKKHGSSGMVQEA